MSSNKRMKERIVESLERWKRVTISFQGIFFDGVKYHLAEFGIINDFWISDNRRNVKINFNQNWIETIKQSSFFKYISFTEMKYLRSPIAIRLYEILSKSFYKRNEWKIGVQKLKDKIPIQDKHYSEIKRKIESAVNTINRKTDMNIKVSAEKTKKNDGVITFSKIQKRMVDYMKETQNNIYFNMPEMESYAGFIEGMDTETLKNLKSQFVEKEIQNNTFLQNRYRKEGFDNLSIQKSFISFAKRNNNE